MKKIRTYYKKIINVGIIGVLILSIFLMSKLKNQEEIEVSVFQTSSTLISNEEIQWGISRKENHIQPDLGTNNLETLEKYQGIALGDSESEKIYLTFDEGYEAGYTEEILDILQENEVTATFFLTAHYINTSEELVKRMIDDGHTIGNHTVNHENMTTLTEEEIYSEVMDLHIAVYEKFNYEMQYIRPPEGVFSEKVIAKTNTLGYTTVMWSFAYVDWIEDNQPSNEEAIEKII